MLNSKKLVKIKSTIESKMSALPGFEPETSLVGFGKIEFLSNNSYSIKYSKKCWNRVLKYFLVRTFLAQKVLYKSSIFWIKIYKPGKKLAYFMLEIRPFCISASKKWDSYFEILLGNQGKTLLRPGFRHPFLESP